MLYGLLVAIHVVGVVIWIGGVTFVTLIVFPMIMRMEGSLEKIIFFQGVEHRFAKIAKATVAIVGLTGLALVHLGGQWDLLFTAKGIGPTIMLIVWTLYVLILLGEAKLFKIIFKGEAQRDTKKIFWRLTVFHWFIMGISLLAVFVGALTAHS